MLTRDQFFSMAPAHKTEDVEVPGAGMVRIRMMTAGERDRVEAAAVGKGAEGFRARIVVASVVGEDGKPLFTYEDVDRISAMPTAYIEPIINAAVKLNAISPKDMADARKNS